MSVVVPPTLRPRMLDIHAATHEAGLIPNYPSRCVAPSAIFWDYERVIARLNASQEGNNDEESIDLETTRWEGETDANSAEHFDHSDADDERDADSNGEEEYQEPSPTRYTREDISELRSSRDVASRRLTRRQKPYSGRPLPSVAANTDSSSTRCPYVSPKDGKRCKKLNRSSQEAGRHWRSCHLYKEAKAMLSGFLPAGKGTAITSEAQLHEVTPMIQCRVCNALITRSDAMRRHARTNCKVLEEPEGTVVEGRAPDSGSE